MLCHFPIVSRNNSLLFADFFRAMGSSSSAATHADKTSRNLRIATNSARFQSLLRQSKFTDALQFAKTLKTGELDCSCDYGFVRGPEDPSSIWFATRDTNTKECHKLISIISRAGGCTFQLAVLDVYGDPFPVSAFAYAAHQEKIHPFVHSFGPRAWSTLPPHPSAPTVLRSALNEHASPKRIIEIMKLTPDELLDHPTMDNRRWPSFVKACLLGRVVRTPPHKTGPSPQVIREFLLRSHAIDLYPRDDDGRVLDFRNWTHGEESKQALSLLPPEIFNEIDAAREWKTNKYYPAILQQITTRFPLVIAMVMIEYIILDERPIPPIHNALVVTK